MIMRREMEMGRHIVQARAPYLLETSPLDLAKYMHLSSSSPLYTQYAFRSQTIKEEKISKVCFFKVRQLKKKYDNVSY